MDKLDVWLKYPFMMAYEEEDATIYQGLINIGDEDYNISVTESKDQSFRITLPLNLILFEQEINSAVNNLQKKNIVEVLDALVKIIMSKIPTVPLVNHCDIYRHVLNEYYEFTQFYLNLKSCYLAQDLSKIDVTIMDDQNREHAVTISVNFGEGPIFKITEDDLPEGREPYKESSSLKAVYEQFLAAVEALQPFFNLMDTFDKNCWIILPLEPKRQYKYRRICLGGNLSVEITVDPYNISSIPDMRFLGPERQVTVYRQNLNENLEEWIYESDIFSKILKLLGMDSFPQKPTEDKKKEEPSDVLKDSWDCSICFSFKRNKCLPEVVCKNKSCESCYHTECLYEWLVSVNARRFFLEVVGTCPNCDKYISCPIPQR